MHFDAAIMRGVTYASLPSHLSTYPPTYLAATTLLSFLSPCSSALSTGTRHPSGIFKCILRRGSPHRDFPPWMRRWKKGILSSVILRARALRREKGKDNVSGRRSTAAQMYSAAKGFPGNLILSWILSRITLRSRRLGRSRSWEPSAAESMRINPD